MYLDLRAMLTGDVTRLAHVTRFSTCNVMHKESVAEHCYFVTLYAMMLADWAVDVQCLHIEVSTVLRRAVLHDLDEARTGDFYRPFKYSSANLTAALKEGAIQAFLDVASETVGDQYGGYYGMYWAGAKDDSNEGCIVALADFLSALSYMMREAQVANFTMREHWETMFEYYHSFDKSCFNFLRPVIDEVADLIKELFPEDGVKL